MDFFNESYMPYNLERDTSLTPSLEEMTETAIKIVSKGNGAENGYFLFIEGGLIDLGHHGNWAQKAFDETVEFSKAINKALEMTSEKDTLIVVTSDHSHTMSISGYPERYNDIFGVAGIGDFGLPYLTINYANGPGFLESGHNYTLDNTSDKDFRFPAVARLDYETHGGDDVGIFARGPWSHLYSGVLEQHIIPHIMKYASCVGEGLTACSGAFSNVATLSLPIILGALFSLFYL
ncbi:hypothetical protein NQ314_006680 [Rhamnusium bicolor]|uniref:alkaline phosphatase n=1 Tax=Rhamnusium bicolor TaxID=1586634 RepID=A0AAV8Z0M5_9CUCU|nr:hypothetical protein NQ314_006680 [Rhamnusium bicolor]